MKANRHNTKFLLLSTSLLVDRVFLYTDLVKTLAAAGDVTIWATSYENPELRSSWERVPARVESFPAVKAFREMPHNFLRRLNEFVWDYRYHLPSRMSMMRHVRDKNMPPAIRALKTPASVMAFLRMEKTLENRLEKLMLSYPRSEEAEARLRADRPDVIVTTGPFQFEQPGIYSIARKLGIPTLAYIPSWDNVSTKNRMVYKYEGYVVWNEQTRRELHEFYPYTRENPVYEVGAPQFDIFRQEQFHQSREDFCAQQQLDPRRPIVVYAVGSPNFLKEHHGAVEFAKRIVAGKLGDAQLLVRPHPIHDNAEMSELFDQFKPSVRLQKTPNAGKSLTLRTQDELQITEWVNTFRHADAVVNLSSTVTVDAAIFDVPVVNLDFDPQPGQFDQALIKDVNHAWNHFKPIAESGGVWLVDDFDEMEAAVRAYLEKPELHREQRKWIVDYVCGHTDGRCGARMAEAVIEFAGRKQS